MNALIEEQIQTSLGMAMVYTIISSLKEWLADQVYVLFQLVGTAVWIFDTPLCVLLLPETH